MHANDRIYVTLLDHKPQAVLEGGTMGSVPLSMANVLEPLKAEQKMQLTGETAVELGSEATEYAVTGSQVLISFACVSQSPTASRDDSHWTPCCSIKESPKSGWHARKLGLQMKSIHGLAAHAAGAQLLPYKYDAGELAENEVEIKISHCGICHSDVHLINNDWGMSKYPFIPGHEIVGTVTAVGGAVRDRQIGERVGVGWQADSCGVCEYCRQGDEHLCAQSQPTCVGRNGGYADAIRVNSRFAIPVPEQLESENVAPLLCAGITVYTPLRNHGVRPSSRVGVIGIGGLGHLGLQFARAFGAEVTAFSTSKDKEEEAQSLGAHHFVNTRDTAHAEEDDGRVRSPALDGRRRSGLAGVHQRVASQGNAVRGRRSALAAADSGVLVDRRARRASPAARREARATCTRCSMWRHGTTSRRSPSASRWPKQTTR